MKATLFALFVALLMVGCEESSKSPEGVDMTDPAPKKDAIDSSKLQIRDGVTYILDTDKPFTGYANRAFDNGQKSGEINYKNGKLDGLSTFWYENGQKKSEVNWRNNKLMSGEVWKPNGEKCPVTNFKDGNGVGVGYNEDGTEKARYTYKDGELVED